MRNASYVWCVLALFNLGCQKEAPAPAPAAATPPAAAQTSEAGKNAAPAASAGAPTDSTPSAASGSAGAAEEDLPEPAKSARSFVVQLVAGKFSEATGRFDATMLTAMPAGKLEESWQKATAMSGAFRKVQGTRSEKVSQAGRDFDVVIVTCEFEKGAHDVRAVFDAEQKIAGLFISPIKPVLSGKEELWLGELNAGGAKLRLLVHLGKTTEGKSVATLDSLDQKQKGIAFDTVNVNENKLRLESKAMQAVFEGEFSEDRQGLSGEWQQGGQKFPLEFKPVDREP